MEEIDLSSIFFKQFCILLKTNFKKTPYLRKIDYDRIPVIEIDNEKKIKITYKKINNVHQSYFLKLHNDIENSNKEFYEKTEDQKYNYFLYSLIINLILNKYYLSGGAIVDHFTLEPFNDFDFYKPRNELHKFIRDIKYFITYGNSNYSSYYQQKLLTNINTNNVFLVVFVLYKHIFKSDINCNFIKYSNDMVKYSRLSFEDKLFIDISDKDLELPNKADFIEKTLYTKYDRESNKIELYSAKKKKFNNLEAFEAISKLMPFYTKLFKKNIIFDTILKMIGYEYIYTLLSIFNICHKKLTITHDDCCDNFTHANLLRINKIVNERIPKIDLKFTFITDNCKKKCCVCDVYLLTLKYINGNYTVTYNLFFNNYYSYELFNFRFKIDIYKRNIYSVENKHSLSIEEDLIKINNKKKKFIKDIIDHNIKDIEPITKLKKSQTTLNTKIKKKIKHNKRFNHFYKEFNYYFNDTNSLVE